MEEVTFNWGKREERRIIKRRRACEGILKTEGREKVYHIWRLISVARA